MPTAQARITWTLFLMLALAFAVQGTATPQPPNCWFFSEVDALHTYSTDAVHALPNGFLGARDPNGSHATPHPITEMTGAYLRMDGGNGDVLTVEAPVSGVTPDWSMTLHYRTAAGCTSRELILIEEFGGGTFQAYTLLGAAALNGSSASFTSIADTWYTLEVINENSANTAELRIWKDGDARPAAALVTTTSSGALADLRFRAGNSCAPEKQLDFLCIENRSLIAVEEATWPQVKKLFRDE